MLLLFTGLRSVGYAVAHSLSIAGSGIAARLARVLLFFFFHSIKPGPVHDQPFVLY
jgi:hypothetical protein